MKRPNPDQFPPTPDEIAKSLGYETLESWARADGYVFCNGCEDDASGCGWVDHDDKPVDIVSAIKSAATVPVSKTIEVPVTLLFAVAPDALIDGTGLAEASIRSGSMTMTRDELDWSEIFNTEHKRWGHISNAITAAKNSGYTYFSWDGRIYEVPPAGYDYRRDLREVSSSNLA